MLHTALSRGLRIVLVAATSVAPVPAFAQRVDAFEELPTVLRTGDAIVIHDANGRKTTGKVNAATAAEVVITTANGDERRFTSAAVRQVRARDVIWDGALWGASFGAVMGGLIGSNIGQAGPALVAASSFWAGVGFGIDALVPARKIYMSNDRGTVTVAPMLNHRQKGVRLAWRF